MESSLHDCRSLFSGPESLDVPSPEATRGRGQYPKHAEGGGYRPDYEKVKVLRMRFSMVEKPSGLCGGIFSLFRNPQFNSRKKDLVDFLFPPSDFPIFPLLPHVVPIAVWDLLLAS